MRTVKRSLLSLNAAKQASLEDLCVAYAHEKQYWLDKLRSFEFQALLGSHRTIRDMFVKEGYHSISGLQARHWKLALQDAVETWDKYWQALFVKVRSKISKRRLKTNEQRYAYFLIKGYKQFAELMSGTTPETAFEIDPQVRQQIAQSVRRLVKRFQGKPPCVKKACSVKFDANCYDLFTHRRRQYIKVMSLERGERIILPLKGHASIEGNITLLLSKEAVQIHVSQTLKQKKVSRKNVIAVDFGYTEVMTDADSQRYGQQFGAILTNRSDRLAKKMKQRNKLHALEKKHSLPQKAKHIHRYNLGRKKLNRQKRRSSASLKCEINQAINQLVKTTQPAILITENLSHLFTYNRNKVMNRRLSSWLRGEIQDRIAFKALAEGFRHEQVNPAYGSQICPACGFVDNRNRHADKFRCLYCRHEDIADRVAAQNYANRYGDPEITLYTPYRDIKTILLDRFHRRLEAEQSATVPGRTLETAREVNPPHPIEIRTIIAGGEKSRNTGRSLRERNKNKHVSTCF